MACVQDETVCNSTEYAEEDDLLVRKIGALLSSCPDVAQTVLSHMTMVELHHCRLVCRLWNTLATKLVAQRCVPHYTIFHDTVDFRNDRTLAPSHQVCPRLLCRSTLQSMSSRPDLCLLFSAAPDIPGYQSDDCSQLVSELDFIRDMMPPQCLSLIVCNLGLVGTVEYGHEATIKKLSQEVCGQKQCPSCSVDTSLSRPNKRRRNSSSSVRRNSDAPLLSETDGNGVAVDGGLLSGEESQYPAPSTQDSVEPMFGVGYSTSVVQKMRRVTKEEHLQSHFSMLCLANNIPDVNFKLFCYATSTMANNAEDPAFNAHVARIIEEEGPLQALLLFEGSADTDATEAYTEAYILAAIERTGGRVAIGGTVNSSCCSNINGPLGQFDADPIATYGIAVCGTGVRAASVVLTTPNVKTLDHAIRELEKLKVVYDPSKRSLAFMLGCIGRNEDWYGRGGRRRRHRDPASLGYALPQAEVARLQKLPASENVEVAMLRSLFPNTPVVGTFGNGEYCHAYQPRPGGDKTVTEEEERALHKLSVRVDAFSYSYSTVVVFLQFDTL